MTKKDYELIASILKFRQEQINERAYKLLIADFINTLASKNPRFNREKFLQACGVEVEDVWVSPMGKKTKAKPYNNREN